MRWIIITGVLFGIMGAANADSVKNPTVGDVYVIHKHNEPTIDPGLAPNKQL